nr:MAG TPA: hypothetical protein [Caudoviricetes sp.]
MCKICTLLLLSGVRPLQFLQQLCGALTAGAGRCGAQGVKPGDLAAGIHGGAGLLFRGHINVAGKRGADVATKQLHLILIHRSFLPGLRCAVGAGQNAGGHSVNEDHFVFFTVSLL